MDARCMINDTKLKLRVSGIIIHDNKILIEKYKDDTYFLPGGTVNLNETSEDAVIRELKEEVDKDFIIDKLLCINEEFYINNKNIKTHCINFYYKMKFKDIKDIDIIDMDRLENDHGFMCQHHYKWIDINDLENIDLAPNKMKIDTYNNHQVIKDV